MLLLLAAIFRKRFPGQNNGLVVARSFGALRRCLCTLARGLGVLRGSRCGSGRWALIFTFEASPAASTTTTASAPAAWTILLLAVGLRRSLVPGFCRPFGRDGFSRVLFTR